MTLAAFGASDTIWNIFKLKWSEILTNYDPVVPYVHMRELIHGNGHFSSQHGWNEKSAMRLVIDCLKFMQTLDKKRFRMFHCTVDISAWRKLRDETYQLPDPVRLCNKYCSEIVVGWYLKEYPGILDNLEFYFDQNEPYRSQFEKEMLQEKKRKERRSMYTLAGGT